MADKTYICNQAIIHLGGTPVLDIEAETGKKGIVLKTVYDEARKMAIVDHPWKFATRRAILTEKVAAPRLGFAHAYALPTGCLRILGMCGSDGEIDPTIVFKVEGGELLTNESTAKVKYLMDIPDEGAFSPGFVMAFSYQLAALGAYGITGNGSLKTAIMEEYLSLGLPKAKSLDSQEGTPELYESNDWVMSRL